MASSHYEELPTAERAQLAKLFQDMYYGNGKPGMTTRMTQVETTQEAQKWYFRAIIGLLLSLLAKMFWPH